MAVGGMVERYTFFSLFKAEKKLSVAKFNDDDSLSFIWAEKTTHSLKRLLMFFSLSDLSHYI